MKCDKKPKAMTTTEKIYLVWIFTVLFAFLFVIFIASVSSRKAYEEALKGNNPYEMKIHYEQQGDKYVPTDTVFVKRKNP